MRIAAVTLLAPAVLLAGCAATSPNYVAPTVKGSESALVINGTRALTGSACLATIVVDGQEAGTVGPYETLVVRVAPGKHFVRWDLAGEGLCPRAENVANRVVTVEQSPVTLRLEISGTGKMFIPIVGMFVRPDHAILLDGE